MLPDLFSQQDKSAISYTVSNCQNMQFLSKKKAKVKLFFNEADPPIKSKILLEAKIILHVPVFLVRRPLPQFSAPDTEKPSLKQPILLSASMQGPALTWELGLVCGKEKGIGKGEQPRPRTKEKNLDQVESRMPRGKTV